MDYKRKTGWIQTFTGKQFFPLEPRVDDVDIEDIAHALSNICRFTGHSKFFYSVAQHSILVSRACAGPSALWGLLHDASEAYLVDVPSPIKASLAGYEAIEQRVMRTICERFGLPWVEPTDVKRSDRTALATEFRDVIGHHAVAPWSNLDGVEPFRQRIVKEKRRDVKAEFLREFQYLTSSGAW